MLKIILRGWNQAQFTAVMLKIILRRVTSEIRWLSNNLSEQIQKKAIFDGAAMDKLTYAILKGNKANLTNVTII
jgi:hypothetical protein